MSTALAYIRYSSTNQNELTVETQKAAIDEKAKQDGFEIVERFIDRAESGRTQHRPEFQRMVALLKSGPVRRLYVYNFSRFARDRETSVVYKAILRREGVTVVSATEPIDTDTAEGRLFEALIEGMDQFYSERLAETTRAGQRKATELGFNVGGRAPYGYVKTPVEALGKTRYRLAPDPDKSDTIQRIFDLANDGYSYRAIATDLNRKGIPGPRGPWVYTSLYSILSNPIYAGFAVWNKARKVRTEHGTRSKRFNPKSEWILTPNAHEAIISKPLWDAVRAKLDARTGKAGRVEGRPLRPLTGLVVCSECGRKLSAKAVFHSKRNQRYRYYYCKAGAVEGCTNRLSFREDYLEAVAIEQLTEILSTPEAVQGIIDTHNASIAKKDTRSQKRSLQARIKALQQSKGYVADAIATTGGGRELIEKYESLEMEEAQTVATLADLTRTDTPIRTLSKKSARALVKQWLSALQGDQVERRKIFHLLLVSVVCRPDNTYSLEAAIPRALIGSGDFMPTVGARDRWRSVGINCHIA
jgi:site-specific DNA recombinase